jgi:hypothetical protein
MKKARRRKETSVIQITLMRKARMGKKRRKRKPKKTPRRRKRQLRKFPRNNHRRKTNTSLVVSKP